MNLYERLFPGKATKSALQSIAQLERSLPGPLGPQLGFEVIKRALRRESIQKPEELHTAIQTTGYSIEVLVLMCARNIICDELQSGRHQTVGTRKTMTGDGLVALYYHLTALLEEKGVETSEVARVSRASLRDAVQRRPELDLRRGSNRFRRPCLC